jgi:hypothetical protein
MNELNPVVEFEMIGMNININKNKTISKGWGGMSCIVVSQNRKMEY